MPDGRDSGGKLILIRDYLAAMARRTTALRGQALEPSAWPSPTAATEAVLQELDTAQEELLVADEELRKQSEELERIRQGIATELRRYRDVFDHSPDGYVETDDRGVIRIANRTLAAQLNLSPEFLERKPLINFVARADCDRFRKMLVRLGNRAPVRAWALLLRPRRGGTPFFVDVHASPVVDPGHRVLAVRWAIRALTSADDEAPLSLTSVGALAHAVVAHASALAAGKRVTLSVELGDDRPLSTQLAARWFPVLSAMVRAELALTAPGAELRVVAKEDGAAMAWHIGGARVCFAAPSSEEAKTSGDEPFSEDA